MENAIIVSIVSVAFAMYVGLTTLRRQQRNEDQQESAVTARITIHLEHIERGVNAIRYDVTSIMDDIKEQRERIIKVEESSKQAHKRLDEIINKK